MTLDVSPSGPMANPSVGDDRGNETCRMPTGPAVLSPQELSALLELPASGLYSKQERDFVLAALLMRGKHLSERTLRRALKSWTPFGELPLRDFLLQRQLVTEEVLAQIEEEGQRFLKSFEQRASWGDGPPTMARRTAGLLERIDPSGRVAKVFGLSRIPRPVEGLQLRTYRAQFRLIRKLGQGGLGTVWLAVDTGLRRYVALKEIAGSGDSHSAVIARFRREAEITGRLDHPSIVSVHLLGENEADGRLFYVMRYLGNETLEDAIRDYHERRESGQSQPLAFHRLLTAFVNLCHAMAHAHSRKVIHRDLKPQNVALDSFGQVVILDWGLAKVLGVEDPQTVVHHPEGRTSDGLDVTMAGQVMGTPMYMAPEQAGGRVDEIDEKTDVYGLGAILFSILTGYAPHELSHESLAPGSQMSALLDLIVDKTVPSPRTINSEVSASLEAICLKAMSRDRDQRYRTAAAMAEDLQRWFADEPITAAEEPAWKRLKRWGIRNPRLSQAAFVTLVCLTVFMSVWGANRLQANVAQEHLQLQSMAEDAHELHAKLTHDIQTLSENVRFMATVPSVQDIVEARRQKDKATEQQWTGRLKRIFAGLTNVNTSYQAVTLVIEDPGAGGAPVRVESQNAYRTGFRTDLAEFLGRHLAAIRTLAAGEVYVGMPGRISPLQDPASPAPGTGETGNSIVAGVPVFDETTEERIGFLVIECDLEELLRQKFSQPGRRRVHIDVVDESGRHLMRFSPSGGLRSIVTSDVKPSDDEVRGLRRLAGSDAEEILAISQTLGLAKIPLDPRKDRWMTFVIRRGP